MKGKRDEAAKNKTAPDYGTFQDFLEIVGKTFSNPMEKERAHQSLKTYKQGGLPMYTFLAQFENLARKARYFREDNVQRLASLDPETPQINPVTTPIRSHHNPVTIPSPVMKPAIERCCFSHDRYTVSQKPQTPPIYAIVSIYGNSRIS
jgi:hypothetical protein